VRISSLADHSENAFDFLRFVAAFAVLYSHSFALLGLWEPFLVFRFPAANIGVYVFFVISGFLVCQSWDRDRSLARFAARRGLRLLPGLFIAVCFTVFILGPLMTTVPVMQYFGAVDTWTYLLSNASLSFGQYALPGVFETNPYPTAINGSLWTLRYEALLYVMLAAIGATTRRRHLRWACLTLLSLFAVGWCVSKALGVNAYALGLPFVAHFGIDFDCMYLALFATFFFAGSSLYVFRHSVRLSILAALVLALPCMFASNIFWATLFLWLFLPYATLVFAYRAPAIFRRFGKRGDLSYGIYVYAFPVQQVTCYFAHKAGAGWFPAFAISSMATVILAALSWHYVERPALDWKARLIEGPRSKAAKTLKVSPRVD
jgi:peptidoglycan/LPS O-acetylase OafA/YrhL